MSETTLRDASLYSIGDLRPAHLADSPERALDLAQTLMKLPAHADASHPTHAQIKADVRALYEIAVPDREGDDNVVLVEGQFVNLNRAMGQR